jgi:hypothetical protein
MPQVPIDEVLGALQILAHRHRRGAGEHLSPPFTTAADDSFPRRSRFEPHGSERGIAPAPDDAGSTTTWSGHDEGPDTRRSRLGSTVLIVASAAVLAVLLVGALSLTRQIFHRAPDPAQPGAATTSAAAATVPVPVRMPNPDGTADLPTIQKALDDCDAEAARKPDALYFVILPLLSPVKDYQPWIAASVGEIGTSVILLRSKDALDGLRDGSLTLYRGSYTFSIIDAATETPHAWSQADGVVRLGKPDAAAIDGFRVRFGFADFVGDTPSNFRFPRQKGVCYWVSALLRQ